MNDLEQQQDELEALTSIYMEDEFALNKAKPGGVFFTNLDLPPNFQVIYRLLSNKYKPAAPPGGSQVRADENVATEDNLKFESFHVKHLPPIELSFELPDNYPSQQKPDFILSCKWLTRGQLSKLCAHLDHLWEEQVGLEILYVWTQFLKEESLKFLDITSSLNISQIYSRQITSLEQKRRKQLALKQPQVWKKREERIKVEGERRKEVKLPDERAVLDLHPSEFIVAVLQKYDEEKSEAVFKKSNQTCNVCFSSKFGQDCIRFEKCGHIFCKDCIRGYFEVQIKDGQVKSLKCLEDKCDVEALPSQVRQVLSEETFAKYDAALLAATLDTMMDIIYCPRKSCQYPVSVEQGETMGRCPSCQYVFCIYCKMAFHGLEPCRLKSDEQQRLIKEYTEGTVEEKTALELRYGRRQLQRLVDNALSEEWVTGNSQKCPHCNVSIEKSSGCNKMTCWRCNSYFCWICQNELDPRAPYRHFNDRNSSCFNRLFEGIANDEDDFFADLDIL
ncbi:E3 ubiquitin-protein ligase RNF14-like [Neocloeon triangulifer]|uniref:E3 ubiquitin-protein ligase RNF14-like n=1 Tax=Neocloeon triangulifer TaxID=2078957 RepID=UPI00286FACA0|nr:E3 ubiquitin-protein ligase RNF14-like [Neocloeon triangulifer]